ncbi:N-acyl-D-amino-acid deacylase family protein [Desulfovibrio litoralis]|uniref:N-acyl-D-amino-acid deacylase n=1 Tax=Desulfovibrio litoralis DSM 11393 TaxID=1121455 RepID=A0A1M7S991_9BACT|nr:D-aminoacylase [Desulfovibrio litoralis]SHN55013.1 N-acyl-D-amino-acid deacylase [Desulfovibrio litoralis DSM 11393]
MKRIIINGVIIDGSGSEGFKGSVAIQDGVISAIGNDISTDGFDDVIDAQGMVISPGFIDTHSHSDLEVFKHPHLTPKVMQGVTTEFLGQDGIALAPLPIEYISPWRKNLAGLDGDKDDFDWEFKTTANYLKLLEKNGSATNLCYLIPHGNVRMEARGLDSGIATETELKKMCQVLQRELDAGGFGFSTGLIYMPCAYSDTREVTELCKVAAKNKVPFVIHQRSEADSILESMEEVISVGRDSGVNVHFSHFKLCGKNNAHLFDKVLALLDKAKAEGIKVSFDQYPYVAGSTMLGVILPPWVHSGGTDKLLERLNSPEDRKKMTADIWNGIQGWDNFVAFAGLDGIFVTDVKTEANKDILGKNLVELGQIRGKEPLEATYDLLYQESNAVGMVDFYGLEEHVKAFIARPEMNVCTDGLLGGKPHPRVYGAFARVLGKYVREERVISLHEAVRKMTSKPAEVFGLKNRGLLKVGYSADITVFDPATIIDKGTYQEPRQYPLGIKHVLVNGTPVVRDSKPLTDQLPGKVLRRS